MESQCQSVQWLGRLVGLVGGAPGTAAAGVQPVGGEDHHRTATAVVHPLALRYPTVVPAEYAACWESSAVASSGESRSNGPSRLPSVASSSTNASSNVTPSMGREPKTPKVASTRHAVALLFWSARYCTMPSSKRVTDHLLHMLAH
jgi:hypothetical protein